VVEAYFINLTFIVASAGIVFHLRGCGRRIIHTLTGIRRCMMSCKDCDKETDALVKRYFFRIGNGNILVFGCEKHVRELQKKIRGG